MSVDPPRHLPPTPEERLRTVVSRMAGGSNAGLTRFARPVKTGTPPQMVPNPTGLASSDRLTLIWSTFDIVTDAGRITSWGGYGSAALDQSGDSIQLSDPVTDDGRVYLFGEGLYCVTLQIDGSAGTASNDQAVAVTADLLDRPSSFTIACSLRGGDPVRDGSSRHATSSTFYSGGGGLSGGGVRFYVDCTPPTVSADIGHVVVRVAVQKIAGF